MRNISKYMRKKIAFIMCFSLVMSMCVGNVFANELDTQGGNITSENNDSYDEDKPDKVEQNTVGENEPNNNTDISGGNKYI